MLPTADEVNERRPADIVQQLDLQIETKLNVGVQFRVDSFEDLLTRRWHKLTTTAL
jgi:hypothetical protein